MKAAKRHGCAARASLGTPHLSPRAFEARRLALGLGFAQLISWGTLYYSVAVLGAPMQRELRLASGLLHALFAGGLAIAGVLAPWAGRLLDRHGGRRVLSTSAVLGAGGFVVLALADGFWLLGTGFALNGIAMALGLYETCFAAVAQVSANSYRGVVAAISVIAGLASSVFWPISHYSASLFGWRGAAWVFAGLLVGCVVIYQLVLPAPMPVREPQGKDAGDLQVPACVRARAQSLSIAFAAASFVGAALSAHLVTTLQVLRFSAERAVWIGACVGALQVLGRIVEYRLGARLPAQQTGLLTFVALSAALLLLLGVQLLPWLIVPFLLAYGGAMGVMTMVKAVVPLELFGTRNAGVVLGRFGAPSLVARAGAPMAFALVTGSSVGTPGALVGLAAIALGAVVAYGTAARCPSSALANTNRFGEQRCLS